MLENVLNDANIAECDCKLSRHELRELIAAHMERDELREVLRTTRAQYAADNFTHGRMLGEAHKAIDALRDSLNAQVEKCRIFQDENSLAEERNQRITAERDVLRAVVARVTAERDAWREKFKQGTRLTADEQLHFPCPSAR